MIRLQSGLIYINSDAAPAISVFRPDDQAFGQQLDEIMLIPPPAVNAQQSRVVDFLWSAGSWWAILSNPDTHSAGVYRFDPQWSFIDQIESWSESIVAQEQPEFTEPQMIVPDQRSEPVEPAADANTSSNSDSDGSGQ